MSAGDLFDVDQLGLGGFVGLAVPQRCEVRIFALGVGMGERAGLSLRRAGICSARLLFRSGGLCILA